MMTVGIVVAIALLTMMLFWDKIPKPKLSSPATPASDQSRLAILGNLDEVYRYFEQHKCDAGMAGVKSLVGHVFEEHPHQ